MTIKQAIIEDLVVEVARKNPGLPAHRVADIVFNRMTGGRVASTEHNVGNYTACLNAINDLADQKRVTLDRVRVYPPLRPPPPHPNPLN